MIFPHTELNKCQHDMLTTLVNMGNAFCVVLEPMTTDSVKQTMELREQLKEAHQLIPIFLEDVSETERFKPDLDKAREAQTRTYTVFKLTALAIMMFTHLGPEGKPN